MVPVRRKKTCGKRFWFGRIETTVYDYDVRVEIS